MPTRPKVEWNAKARRYAFRTPKGGYGFMSEAAVRGVVDNGIDVVGSRMAHLGSQLKQSAQAFKDGTIDEGAYCDAVKEYRDSMASQIKGSHISQAMAAVGGAEQMTQQFHGMVGGILKAQYRYLENAAAEFAGNPDVVLGLVPGKVSIEDRSTAYAESTRGTYALVKDADMQGGNFKSKENKLEEGAHHCVGTRSCIAMTDLGRVAIKDPRYIMEGRRKCNVYCKCVTLYFKAAA